MARPSSSSAWSLLIYGGAALALVWIAAQAFKKGTEPDVGPQGSGPGGILGWFNKLLGGRARAGVALETDAPQGYAGPDSSSSGVGPQGVTGHFAIQSGDSVNRELWAGTVRVPVALVNSGPAAQQVLVQIHAYWDFLVNDEANTWEQLVTVNGKAGHQLEADLAVPSSVMISNPTLYLDLTVAGVHQDRIENVEVS